MKAVIMAGGFGTRLRPLTANIPKPMVPVVGKPIMEHIIRLLKIHGIDDILAILYFQSDQIKSYFKNGKSWGVNIEYVTAEADFGTAGAVKNAQDLLKERFIIISGDVLTDFNLTEALEYHHKKKADSTIVLTRVDNPLSYGIVITGENGKITRFLEKPGWGQVFSDTVNTGIYILEPEILDMIPVKTEFDFSKDLFPAMLAQKMKLMGYVSSGYWRDIGNIEEYFSAHQDILDGKVKIKIDGKKLNYPDANVLVGENTIISHGADFSGCVVIGDNVKIGPRAKIFQSVIGSNSIIGRDANVNRIVTWENATIGPMSRVSEAILCNSSHVGEESEIEENCILSDNSRVGDGARIKRNVKIWPNKEVESGAILNSSLIWGEMWTRELFSDAKVTGVGNAEITPEFATKLGAAYGAMLGEERTVALSRGASDASRMIYRAVMCGLLSAGVNVADLRIAPIPILRQVLKGGREAGGIHVRMNPDGNGEIDIIFFEHGGRDLPTSKNKTIERLFLREDFRRAPIGKIGNIEYPPRALESYRDAFISHFDKELFSDSKLKVIIDYSFGAASDIMPNILGQLGIDAVSLNSFVDPRKVHYFAGSQREALKQLGSIVKSLDADIGFMLNPGAEKIIAVDEKGNPITSQKLLLKVTELFCQSAKPKKIAAPVTATAGLEMVADEHGAEILWIPSDHQAMMEAASNPEIGYVGGTKGGFIFPGFQIGVDAMFVTVKILELLAKAGTKIGRVTGDWDRLEMAEKEVACAWAKKGQVMRHLMADSENSTRILVDGARLSVDDGWVLLRPDRKKALFYILAESYSSETAKELVKQYAKSIRNWQKNE